MLQDLFKNMIFACLGMQEILREFLNDLVKRGKMSESEAAKIVNEFISKSEEAKEGFKENFKEMIQKTLQGMNLATKDEIESLKSLINEINLRITKIEEKLKE
ncbi:phasin family protein [Thermodesulfovibrio sp. TK110]